MYHTYHHYSLSRNPAVENQAVDRIVCAGYFGLQVCALITFPLAPVRTDKTGYHSEADHREFN